MGPRDLIGILGMDKILDKRYDTIIIVIAIILISGTENVVAQGSPDLVVSNVVWNPTSPTVGSSVTFTVTVKNQGNDAVSSSYIYYYIDGSKVDYDSVNSISPGGSATTTFSWVAQAGSHSIKAVVDPENKIIESNEGNNENTVNFIGTPSDLIISDIVWNPTSPSVGSSTTITVTINNQGAGNALGTYVYYYIDGSKVDYDSINSLSSGGSATSTFSWIVQPGSHSIKAVIDPENKVTESDESNNEKTVDFTGTPSDLTVSDIVWNPTNPPVGSSATFTVSIKNQGSGDALGTYVYYFIDGSKIDYDSINSLSSGGSTTSTFSWIVKPGNHSIKAIIDPENKISESNEGNNENTVNFIGIPSDLTISDITWSPTNPPVGSSSTFTVTIKNYGDGDALGSYIYYFVDGSKIDYDSINGLSTGGSTTTSFTWIAQAGIHSIKAVIDPENKISESDESNNEKIVNFTGIQSDLTVSDIVWNKEGNYVTFTITIDNQGDGDALGSYINYLIDGSKVDYDSINGISSGGSTTATFRWMAQQGNHVVKAIIDPENKISESEESNNEKTVNFDISLEPTYTPPKITPIITPRITVNMPTIQTTQTSSKPKKASVDLHGERTNVEMGQEILLKGSIVSFNTNKDKMFAQVTIIPPSGFSVTSANFVKSPAGQYTSDFDLDPGKGKDIEVTIIPNEPGEFNVIAKITYYFGEDKSTGEYEETKLPIKVRGGQGQGQTTPGFTVEILIISILSAILLIRKYR